VESRIRRSRSLKIDCHDPEKVAACARRAICLDEARRNGARPPVAALVDQFDSDVQAMSGHRRDTSSLIARHTRRGRAEARRHFRLHAERLAASVVWMGTTTRFLREIRDRLPPPEAKARSRRPEKDGRPANVSLLKEWFD
jgi:hypothetical protein